MATELPIDTVPAKLTTAKQKSFGYDFAKDIEDYEVWDEIEIGAEYTAAQTFEVELEDLLAYARGVEDENPLFTDPSYAEESVFGEIIPHPLFLVQVGFYCIEKGRGSWIRSPGAANPGQVTEILENFRLGEVITVRMTAYDKWVRGKRHFARYRLRYYNQHGALKAIWWLTLILPRDRDQLRFYASQASLYSREA